MKECIIVTEIKYRVVNNTSPYIVPVSNNRSWKTVQECLDVDFYPDTTMETETIYPREFLDPLTNKRKWIGMTKDVYEQLRLPYAAIDELEEYVGLLRLKEFTLKTRIKEAKRYLATRWKAVKGARKNELYHKGQLGTHHQLRDRIRKLESMTVWQFIKYKMGVIK